jgi:hypothetical protein
MHRAIILIAFAVALLSARSVTASESPSANKKATILFGTSKSADNFIGIWERLIYTEAFSRLNMRVQFIQMSLRRSSAAAENGDIDAEAPKTWSHGNEYPGLIRVDEPVFEISLDIYTANPSLKPNSLDAFPRNLNVEFRRDVTDCRDALQAVFSPDRISDIASSEQGLRKLIAGRTDLYCDAGVAIAYILSKSKDGEFASVRKVSNIGRPVPLYTYLSKKDAALAPRLTAVLKQMKTEGLFERYKVQAAEQTPVESKKR